MISTVRDLRKNSAGPFLSGIPLCRTPRIMSVILVKYVFLD